MPGTVEIKKGQTFQDGTGLTVRVGEIDASDRVHFAVIKDRESVYVGDGEMSCLAFIHRFTRINSVEEACARIKQLGYVASRRVRIYGEEFELLSDPFPQADQIAIRAKAKSDSRVRILRLPVTIVQGGRKQQVTAA
jgi:hypothetical protein